MNRVRHGAVLLCVSLGAGSVAVRAQSSGLDEAIDQIRRLEEIRALDQERIKEWVRKEVNSLAALPPGNGPGDFNAGGFKAFRLRFSAQYKNAGNTAQFRTQFAAQTANIATAEYAKPDLRATVAVSLARVLLDMSEAEVIPGLIAGLKSSNETARYLSATGLAKQQRTIRADQNLLTEVVAALQAAGEAESSPVVLGRMYEALAYPDQAQTVLDAYLRIFDKRLQYRRGPAVVADGAEIAAYEFFRERAVASALNPNQKAELVRRLAVFLRLDARRYNDPTIAPPKDPKSPDLSYYERERLERMLDAIEDILTTLVGEGQGGNIRGGFASGGYDNREIVLQQAYRWVGNAETNEAGALNDAPWNVPIGAP